MVVSPKANQTARLAMLLILCASGVVAATRSPDLNVPAAPRDLSSILQTDMLGYSCIQEADIDAAFHMTGKGLRLPQTCLPNPCNAALDRAGLGAQIGRPPTEAEWDEYYARYAETCRREVIDFGQPDAFGPTLASADVTPLSAETTEAQQEQIAEFWAPLVPSYGANAPLAQRLNRPPNLSASARGTAAGGTSPRGALLGGLGGSVGGGLSAALDTAASGTATNGDTATAGLNSEDLLGGASDAFRMLSSDTDSGRIIPTPLPPTAWMFAAALLGAFGLRPRRSRAKLA